MLGLGERILEKELAQIEHKYELCSSKYQKRYIQ